MEGKKFRFAFAGGGTGGHIYPGLAIADELRSLAAESGTGVEVRWYGNSSGMDRRLVEASGSADSFVGIPSGKLRRYFSPRNFIDVFKIFAGFVRSLFSLARFRPDALFSKGGFVSVPPCAAARLLGIPVLTHECDFTPGLATRINARFASRILVSFSETAGFLPPKARAKARLTGNPVRPAFHSADAERGRGFLFSSRSDYDPKRPVLLVVGGSLGARQLNSLVEDDLAWLTERFNVVHQRGGAAGEPPSAERYFPHAFIYGEMPDVLACADVVLSRAGSNSLWECAALAKPLVLVPLCGSGTRGDQVDNAEFFRKAGAAEVLLGEEAGRDNLRAALSRVLGPDAMARMSAASRALSDGSCADGVRPARAIASLLLEAAESGGKI